MKEKRGASSATTWIALCFPLFLAHSLVIAVTCNVTSTPDANFGRYLFALHPALMICSASAMVGIMAHLVRCRFEKPE